MDVQHFVSPFTAERPLNYFLFSAITSFRAVNIHMQVCIFIAPGYKSRSVVTGSCGKFIYNLFKKLPNSFQSG